MLLGKQQVEGDSNQVGQMLAEYLGWPQATFAGAIKSEDDKALVVGREVDGGDGRTCASRCPPWSRSTCASSARNSVQSTHTAPTHAYADGVRFAALMAIMAAKKKPLAEVKLADLAADTALKVAVRQASRLPPSAQGGREGEGRRRSSSQKLKTEAKVI